MISLENFSKKDIDTAYYIGWVIHLVLVYLYLDRPRLYGFLLEPYRLTFAIIVILSAWVWLYMLYKGIVQVRYAIINAFTILCSFVLVPILGFIAYTFLQKDYTEVAEKDDYVIISHFFGIPEYSLCVRDGLFLKSISRISIQGDEWFLSNTIKDIKVDSKANAVVVYCQENEEVIYNDLQSDKQVNQINVSYSTCSFFDLGVLSNQTQKVSELVRDSIRNAMLQSAKNYVVKTDDGNTIYITGKRLLIKYSENHLDATAYHLSKEKNDSILQIIRDYRKYTVKEYVNNIATVNGFELYNVNNLSQKLSRILAKEK